ncbi:hypothetical protein BSL78_16750 [Apostichopus japonicus]|uniref:IgGFc-binding protein N-terminal domain-containing protein n=1 Tax=Stichopus japonicus TaxID=307972 RepID=A0A2G8KEI2_STIJA|nr:hypothetical protein BSL78_16750 [Apostichopus japonicus]
MEVITLTILLLVSADPFIVQYIFPLLPMTCSENKPTVTKLFISTGSDHNETNGTISFLNQNIDDIFFSISPSEGIYIDVPDTAVSSVLDFIGNMLLNTTVVVSADETVRVYVQQYCNNTAVGSYGQCSTTYRVRGVDEIGREYWVLMHYFDDIAKIAILALEDDTIVLLTPPSYSTDDTLEVTIHAFQTLYVGYMSDISGTKINASRPILVLFSYQSWNTPYADYICASLIDCLDDVSRWDRHVVLYSGEWWSWQHATYKLLSPFDTDINVTSGRVTEKSYR